MPHFNWSILNGHRVQGSTCLSVATLTRKSHLLKSSDTSLWLACTINVFIPSADVKGSLARPHQGQGNKTGAVLHFINTDLSEAFRLRKSHERCHCPRKRFSQMHLKKPNPTIMPHGQAVLDSIVFKDVSRRFCPFTFCFLFVSPGEGQVTKSLTLLARLTATLSVSVLCGELSSFSLCHFWHSPGFCASVCCVSVGLLRRHPWGSIRIKATRQKPGTHDKAYFRPSCAGTTLKSTRSRCMGRIWERSEHTHGARELVWV